MSKLSSYSFNLSHFIALLYIALCLFLGSVYMLQGSFRFDADIARDFLLLDELATKKVVLIGPRASGIPGVFHGPLWIYLNFPAYWLGGGNPLVVSWFWVGLAALFLASSYFLLKSITSEKTALVFSLLMVGMLIPWLSQMLNPVGALMTVPLIIFSAVQYQQTAKPLFLAGTLLALGVMIQFQMAAGVPLTLLVLLWLGVGVVKRKLWTHLLLLPLLALPLATFLLFDLRHDFVQTRSVLAFVLGDSSAPSISLFDRLQQRVWLYGMSGIYLFPEGRFHFLNTLFFALCALQAAGKLLKLPKAEAELFRFLFYLYSGFYLISLLFNGFLHRHYWWPLVPVAFLMVSLILSYLPRRIFLTSLLGILVIQLIEGYSFARSTSNLVGKVEDDWKFQQNLAVSLFKGEENSFGYFIFTPDVYAYESKAAMTYALAQHPEKTVYRYQKQPVTYLIVAPDPSFRPDVTSGQWKKERVRLEATPTTVIHFPDGYQVERYELTPELLEISPDSTIDDWLHFR